MPRACGYREHDDLMQRESLEPALPHTTGGGVSGGSSTSDSCGSRTSQAIFACGCRQDSAIHTASAAKQRPPPPHTSPISSSRRCLLQPSISVLMASSTCTGLPTVQPCAGAACLVPRTYLLICHLMVRGFSSDTFPESARHSANFP